MLEDDTSAACCISTAPGLFRLGQIGSPVWLDNQRLSSSSK